MAHSVRISDEHDDKLEQIIDDMPFQATKKSVVEGLIDEYVEEDD